MYFQNHNNRFQKNSFKKENNNFTQNTYTEQIPFNNETILQDIKKMDDNYLLSISNTKWDGVSNFTFNYYAIDELCNRYSEFKKQVENKNKELSHGIEHFTTQRAAGYPPNKKTKPPQKMPKRVSHDMQHYKFRHGTKQIAKVRDRKINLR